eukprot:scaffold103286_cov17-Tisochrysis_lutea.AAC.1
MVWYMLGLVLAPEARFWIVWYMHGLVLAPEGQHQVASVAVILETSFSSIMRKHHKQGWFCRQPLALLEVGGRDRESFKRQPMQDSAKCSCLSAMHAASGAA